MYIHIYLYAYMCVCIYIYILVYTYVFSSEGAKYCTPEIDTSEITADSQWHSRMACQWHFPTDVHFCAPGEADAKEAGRWL